MRLKIHRICAPSNQELYAILFYVSIIIFIHLAQGCSRQSTPEQIVTEFVQSVEEAAEQSKGRILRNLISADYKDTNGRDKKQIDAIASGYLMRNRSLHILSIITEFSSSDEHTISATVLAAISATLITERSMLSSIDADIYWFDITISDEDGTWKLLSANWKQAMLDDFLNTD